MVIREKGQEAQNNFRSQQMCLVVRQPTHSTAMVHEMLQNMGKIHKQTSSLAWETCYVVLIKHILHTEHRKKLNHNTPCAYNQL